MHRLKSVFYALLAFLAATSISVGDGGVLLLRLPPLDSLISHADLYASGLLTTIEIFARLVPSSADNSLVALLGRVADSLLPNRVHGGGRFVTNSVIENGPVPI